MPHVKHLNLPGSRVYKKDRPILSDELEDFILQNKLPVSIWPDILEVLYLRHDIDLNDDNNILDTDINKLDNSLPAVDLNETEDYIILLEMSGDVPFKTSGGLYIRLKPS